MKIVDEYLITLFVSNGPSSYEQIVKVVLLENGNVYEVCQAGGGVRYIKLDRELFDKRVKYCEL